MTVVLIEITAVVIGQLAAGAGRGTSGGCGSSATPFATGRAFVDGYVLQAVVALLHTGGSDQEQVAAFREDFANVLADAEAKADRDMAN